ncbi:hypothetical protein [Algisphaera agarilytica]|uniref:DUF2029 domain-containing protein n=1 Tax=Algisphaera agarilytica TaxID=1385975 RepID=A0A7X0H3S2_9BACT|nr:hypothetical protein [Algisphaera agarilytica]MBB6428726.1 hypothetical protein [Algisphaera agarilytica]
MIVPDAALLWTVWIGSAVIWLGLSLLVFRRNKLTRKHAPWIILGVAAVVRLGYVFFMPVSMSDDIWRYVYDGQMLAAGQNPYGAAPIESIEASTASGDYESSEWMTWINNKELVTIYQPTSQWIFAGVAKTYNFWAGEAGTGVGAATAFRLAFALIDLLIVLLLLVQLKSLGRSPWWAVMYAWSPLVIVETSWAGHQDGIGIAAMIGSLMLAQRAWRWEGQRLAVWCAIGAGVLLALAAGVKPIVMPLALLMAWKLRSEVGGWGRIFLAAGSCVLALVLLYVPFTLMAGGLDGMFETSRQFVERWSFNGSLHPLIEAGVQPFLSEGPVWEMQKQAKRWADLVSGVLLMGVLVLAMLFHRVPWRAATTFFFAMVCLSSTVHPWYLLWAMALLPVAWSAGRTIVGPAVWVASLTLPWSYWAWVNYANGGAFDGEYQIGTGLTLAVWLPVYAALGWGAWKVRGVRGEG